MLRFPKPMGWALLALLPLTFTACEDDDPDPEPMSIVDVASADARFGSLVAALTAADLVSTLDGTTEYTVFAPTNEAFTAFLNDNGFATLDDVPVDLLTNVLLNHVVAGTVRSTDLSDGYVSTLATEASTGNGLSLLVDLSSGVVLNGSTRVDEADIDAANGVIHVVDEVIALPTVVDLALDNDLFTTLVAALTRADLTTDYVTTLSGGGPFTVFAPTNDAFGDLLAGNPDWTTLDDIPVATLEAVLNYHVVNGANVLSETLTDGQEVTTLGGGTFTINLGTDVTITDGAGGTSTVVATDVQGINGVVHVISAVLLP
jgi:uncharacterized surface protein with fasciclin (FAS1) repeats